MGALIFTLYILACLAGYCVWENHRTERGNR